MKLKRMAAGGFVGAIALGAMVLAGPAAEAATATPASAQDACDIAVNDGIFTLLYFGMDTPAEATAQNVYNYLIFDAYYEGVQSTEGGDFWQVAGVVYVDCGL
jgi:hypothetical protein